MTRLTILAALVAVLAASAFSQAIDDSDVESFNDLQFTAPLARQFDFQTSVALRLGNNLRRAQDGRIQIGFVWKPTKTLSVTPFYWNIYQRNAAGLFRREHRLSVRAVRRFEFPRFAIVHRSTYEYRMRAVGNTWRYRAGLAYERDLPKKLLDKSKFTIGDEIYYDSASGRVNRNRITVGISRTINKNLAVDLSFMHQNDGLAHPGDLNVVWLSWRVRL